MNNNDFLHMFFHNLNEAIDDDDIDILNVIGTPINNDVIHTQQSQSRRTNLSDTSSDEIRSDDDNAKVVYQKRAETDDRGVLGAMAKKQIKKTVTTSKDFNQSADVAKKKVKDAAFALVNISQYFQDIFWRISDSCKKSVVSQIADELNTAEAYDAIITSIQENPHTEANMYAFPDNDKIVEGDKMLSRMESNPSNVGANFASLDRASNYKKMFSRWVWMAREGDNGNRVALLWSLYFGYAMLKEQHMSATDAIYLMNKYRLYQSIINVDWDDLSINCKSSVPLYISYFCASQFAWCLVSHLRDELKL